MNTTTTNPIQLDLFSDLSETPRDKPLDPCPFCGADDCQWDCEASQPGAAESEPTWGHEDTYEPDDPDEVEAITVYEAAPEPAAFVIPEAVIDEARFLLEEFDRADWPENEIYSVATGFDLYAFVDKGKQVAYLYPLGRNDAILQLRCSYGD